MTNMAVIDDETIVIPERPPAGRAFRRKHTLRSVVFRTRMRDLQAAMQSDFEAVLAAHDDLLAR